MFADYLSDSPWENRSHRGWTTLASFALQTLLVGGLLLMPMIYTQSLPRLQLMAALALPTPPPAPPAPGPRPHTANQSSSNMAGRFMVTPPTIPNHVEHVDDQGIPPAPDLRPGQWVEGGTGDSNARSAVLNSLGNGLNPLPPPSPMPVAKPPRISHIMEGNLIYRLQPVYPALARQARIQGTVVLRAVISREGRIENVQLMSGHPMLVQAAMEAVRQWRYRPYILNDQPVEVETVVTVNFTLGGG